MLHVMDDGITVDVRPIRPGDKPLLAAGYARLSDEAKRLRFLAPKAHLSAADLRYLTEVDGRDHAALVAVRDAGGAPAIVGVARYVRLAEEWDTAEFAIVIADELQGRRVGSELTRLLAAHARRYGIRRFRATVLQENAGIRALLAGIAPDLERESAGNGVEELVGRLAA